MRRLRFLWVLWAALWVAAPVAQGSDVPLVVTVLSHGSGRAVLLQCGGQAMLVDTGSRAEAGTLLRDLLSLGIVSFECIAITGGGAAEAGGLARVLEVYETQRVWAPDFAGAEPSSCYQHAAMVARRKGIALDTPAAGDTFPLGSATVVAIVGEQTLTLRVEHGAVRLDLPDVQALETASYLSDGSELIEIGIREETEDKVVIGQ